MGNLSDVQISFGKVNDVLCGLLPDKRVIVITDANIDRLYSDMVRGYDHIIVGGGEANKNLLTVQNVYLRLMELGADRSTFLLGIGGGIVTDITGYVAATYMRGVEFGFISTTLLGQVDASVGGKNGVNVEGYKNMVGTFAQPRFIISDARMLRTLAPRELKAGMAEVIKVAIISDGELFDYLENSGGERLFDDADAMRYVVESAVRLKMDIVARDERESGVRRLLNLGHTIGHAIEKCVRDVNHGEAVAMGLSQVVRAAARRGVLDAAVAERVDALLRLFGFNVELPVSMASILREVRMDKKKHDDKISVVVPDAIGRCRILSLTFEEFEKMFE